MGPGTHSHGFASNFPDMLGTKQKQIIEVHFFKLRMVAMVTTKDDFDPQNSKFKVKICTFQNLTQPVPYFICLF